MTWGSHQVRSELDILVVLYKSVCSVTVSIGEISFSLLARLEAWEWGQQGYCSPIMQSVKPGAISGTTRLVETINLDREAAPPGREAATTIAVRG